MKKIYVITDTHFNHKKLIEWGRPIDFEAQILTNLKKTVKPGDIIIHLGDVCIGRDNYWHLMFQSVLFGTKRILVRGNHDGKSDSWYMDHGWNFVCNSFKGRYFGKNILFTHRPHSKNEGIDINLHGHLHGNGHRLAEENALIKGYNYDCAPDLHNFKPLLLNSLVNKIS